MHIKKQVYKNIGEDLLPLSAFMPVIKHPYVNVHILSSVFFADGDESRGPHTTEGTLSRCLGHHFLLLFGLFGLLGFFFGLLSKKKSMVATTVMMTPTTATMSHARNHTTKFMAHTRVP